jgi:hypothetical protein
MRPDSVRRIHHGNEAAVVSSLKTQSPRSGMPSVPMGPAAAGSCRTLTGTVRLPLPVEASFPVRHPGECVHLLFSPLGGPQLKRVGSKIPFRRTQEERS